MKVLGVDLGDKRIGLAISDAEGKLAVPLKTLNRNGKELEEIIKTKLSEGIEEIVIGLPLNMDGSLGEQGEKARRFARELEEKTALHIELWDERLSTFEAERRLREAGKKGDKLKKSLDIAAATVILQDYLDHKRQN